MGVPRFSMEALDGILLLLTQTEAAVKALKDEQRRLRKALTEISAATVATDVDVDEALVRVYRLATAALTEPPK